MTPRTAAVALALTATGCATIVQGSDQRVRFETQPPGATVRADMQTCTTPCSLRLKRNRNVEAKVRMPGYAPETVLVRYELDPWILGNLAFLVFAPMGGAVDIVSGAGFQLYPSYVVIPLQEAGADAPPSGAAPVPPAPEPDENGEWKPIPGGEAI